VHYEKGEGVGGGFVTERGCKDFIRFGYYRSGGR
jgi:hypothetical protein